MHIPGLPPRSSTVSQPQMDAMQQPSLFMDGHFSWDEYRRLYPDVAANHKYGAHPLWHYIDHGFDEGRLCPVTGPDGKLYAGIFHDEAYLWLHPDVRASPRYQGAGAGFQHFKDWGAKENRIIRVNIP